jgi:hypothetical protein
VLTIGEYADLRARTLVQAVARSGAAGGAVQLGLIGIVAAERCPRVKSPVKAKETAFPGVLRGPQQACAIPSSRHFHAVPNETTTQTTYNPHQFPVASAAVRIET